MDMLRTAGEIAYELTYKKVKRVNLRVRTDGIVAVSAPRRVPLSEIDRFVASHADWIASACTRIADRPPFDATRYSESDYLAAFMPVMERMYPLIAPQEQGLPALKIRLMKSRWGVCYPTKNQITLNKQLIEKPMAALEYVVLHELVHLLHPNHQAEFHATIAYLMPDYKVRKKLLQNT